MPFWIESHVGLRTNRKLVKLTRLLDLGTAQAVGHLHLLWWAVLLEAPHGDITKWDADDVAIAADWHGNAGDFVNALMQTGFLEEVEDHIVVHDWWAFGAAHLQNVRTHEEKSEVGRMNAHKRWHVNERKPNPDCDYCTSDGAGMGTHMGTHSVPNGADADRTHRTDRPKDFDRFWEAFPRKVGKRKALAAYVAASKRTDEERIIEGAKRYAADPNREDAFTAHPTTWLNRDGWDDPPLPGRKGGNGGNGTGHDPAFDIPPPTSIGGSE